MSSERAMSTEMTMSPEMSRTENDITPEALAHLGDGRIAYVKAIRSEDVAALFPQMQVPKLAPGVKAVRAARRRRHADHADRQPRSRGRQCLEPGARDGQRALTRSVIQGKRGITV